MSDDGDKAPPQEVATPGPQVGLPPFGNLALVAAGGAGGALARVALATWFPVADDAFPWTTFAENVGGAFLLGLILTLLVERLAIDQRVRLLVCTGALGAFTTYSTVAIELTERLADARLGLAAAYAAASLAAGLIAGLAGIRLARALPPDGRAAR